MLTSYRRFRDNLKVKDAAAQDWIKIQAVVKNLVNQIEELEKTDRPTAKLRAWSAVAEAMGVSGCADHGLPKNVKKGLKVMVDPILPNIMNLGEVAINATIPMIVPTGWSAEA